MHYVACFFDFLFNSWCWKYRTSQFITEECMWNQELENQANLHFLSKCSYYMTPKIRDYQRLICLFFIINVTHCLLTVPWKCAHYSRQFVKMVRGASLRNHPHARTLGCAKKNLPPTLIINTVQFIYRKVSSKQNFRFL